MRDLLKSNYQKHFKKRSQKDVFFKPKPMQDSIRIGYQSDDFGEGFFKKNKVSKSAKVKMRKGFKKKHESNFINLFLIF